MEDSPIKRLVAQTQPRFVDQRGGLQRVARLLARHLRAGEEAQLGIDLREQGIRRIGLTALDGTEEEREVTHGFASLRESRRGASKGVSLGPITR